MSKARRILQVVDSLQPGGMENVMVQMLARLDPERFSSEVCCITQGGAFEARLPPEVKVHVLHKPPGVPVSSVLKLGRLLDTGRYDVVHTRHLGGLIHVALARPVRRHPHVVHSEHTLLTGDELSLRRHWQRRVLYRRASAIFTVSQEQRVQIERVGLRHPRLSTIINGVDSTRFLPPEDRGAIREELGLAQEGRWVGMVARFGPHKRHVELLEAFDRAAALAPQLRLLLVGDGGPEKARVLARIEASPYRDRIHWAGFQLNPVPWYQAMDALIVSSSNEGMPNAVLEAMACGVPVVANDVCGISEILDSGVQGWVENLASVDRLAQALGDLAQRPDRELHRRGQAARERALKRFSVEKMVEAYEVLYSSLDF